MYPSLMSGSITLSYYQKGISIEQSQGFSLAPATGALVKYSGKEQEGCEIKSQKNTEFYKIEIIRCDYICELTKANYYLNEMLLCKCQYMCIY